MGKSPTVSKGKHISHGKGKHIGKGKMALKGSIPFRGLLTEDNFKATFSAPALRRLARKAGIKRLSTDVYEATREVLKIFVHNVMNVASKYTYHRLKKTITLDDMWRALSRNDFKLYFTEMMKFVPNAS